MLSLSLLSDVEKTLKSLKVPPLRLPQFKIAWGTRILIRRPQGLCRATIDWKEPKGAWWHCIFDDLGKVLYFPKSLFSKMGHNISS